jgi:hypothetical protein
MNRHEWHDRTPEGDKRFYRASYHSSRWTFETTLEKEEDWHLVDPPDRDYLEGLRDVLFRKYQRRRVPHKILAEIDSMIEDLPADEVPTDESSSLDNQ